MRFNLNNISRDRKNLYMILSIMIVSICALSVAYAILSTTLNITGSTEIASSSWNIYLDNVEVRRGSVEAAPPEISGTSSVSFDVDLTLPGDFYEFTVDVVNDGSIDAMIDSVVKTPELTTDQAKYIKYEITYENGESINEKQTLKKETTTTIKVRVEYRKDLSASDLPSTTTELSLGLTLVYIQSDGSGVDVKNNGVDELPKDYARLNYIESTGTQYINTGISLNQDSILEVTFSLNNLTRQNITGIRTSSNSQNISIMFANPHIILDFTNDEYLPYRLNYPGEVGEIYSAYVSKNIRSISKDGIVLASISSVNSSTFTTKNAYICNFGSPGGSFQGKIYSVKITNEGVLVRDFVPCYRKSDNVIGMYDLVNNLFYTNEGSGKFTGG